MVSKDPVDGSSIVTTLDVNLQSIVEKHIKSFNLLLETEGEDGKKAGSLPNFVYHFFFTEK